jgi:hypothetical protein
MVPKGRNAADMPSEPPQDSPQDAPVVARPPAEAAKAEPIAPVAPTDVALVDAAAVAAEPVASAPADPIAPVKPAEPASPAKEWATAVVVMIVFAFICAAFISVWRGG